jgi:hypothetical protein
MSQTKWIAANVYYVLTVLHSLMTHHKKTRANVKNKKYARLNAARGCMSDGRPLLRSVRIRQQALARCKGCVTKDCSYCQIP